MHKQANLKRIVVITSTEELRHSRSQARLRKEEGEE
jgi:dephospho-CoA kinase